MWSGDSDDGYWFVDIAHMFVSISSRLSLDMSRKNYEEEAVICVGRYYANDRELH